MRLRLGALLPVLALALAACGKTPRDKVADQLDNAAEQSDPAAAEVLTNAAGQMRDDDTSNAPTSAQDALEQAGNAQMETPTPTRQALPHRAGEFMPPATVDK